ncbi:hypothetical protein J3E68DRAFT_189643 [Trichoderma sp. SZMC 28012]
MSNESIGRKQRLKTLHPGQNLIKKRQRRSNDIPQAERMLVLICISQGMACILLLVCMKPTNTPCLRLVRLAFPHDNRNRLPLRQIAIAAYLASLPLSLFINSFASLIPKMHGSDGWWCLDCVSSPLVDAAVDAIFSSRLGAYLSSHCLERYKKKACPPSLREYISFQFLSSSISYLHISSR